MGIFVSLLLFFYHVYLFFVVEGMLHITNCCLQVPWLRQHSVWHTAGGQQTLDNVVTIVDTGASCPFSVPCSLYLCMKPFGVPLVMKWENHLRIVALCMCICVFLYVYVCLCVHVSVCMNVCLSVCVMHMCVSVYVCYTYMCICLYMSVCVCLCVPVCLYKCICVCVHVCLSVHVAHMCVHVYVCLSVYVHVHTCVYSRESDFADTQARPSLHTWWKLQNFASALSPAIPLIG